jgi:hypothetical protein
MATGTRAKNPGGRPTRAVGYWGQKVAVMAEPLGLTYGDMAKLCKVSTSTFGNWMAGEATVPSYAVEVLADRFGVSTDALRTTPRKRR